MWPRIWFPTPPPIRLPRMPAPHQAAEPPPIAIALAGIVYLRIDRLRISRLGICDAAGKSLRFDAFYHVRKERSGATLDSELVDAELTRDRADAARLIQYRSDIHGRAP